MKIVHVCDYYMPTMGYQETVLPKWHVSHGHDVHVVTSDRYADVPNYSTTWEPFLGPRHVGASVQTNNGVTVHRLKSISELRNRLWLRGLTASLDEIRPQAIFGHGTTNFTFLALARYARKHSLPLFLDCHMLYSVQDRSRIGRLYYAAIKRITRRWVTPHVVKYFGVANECCAFLEMAQGVPSHKVELLPLGVDTDAFRPNERKGEEVRRALGVTPSNFLVMQTGKLTPDKAPHLLAEAMAPLMARDGTLSLAFVGGADAAYLERIREPLRVQGVLGRVHFLPFVNSEELAGHFSAADLVVFPGGSSLSALEAAGCGSGVLMTDHPAGQWRAAEGIGDVFRDGDVTALREAIVKYATRDAALKLGDAALAAVETKFSYDVIASDLERQMAAAIPRGMSQ